MRNRNDEAHTLARCLDELDQDRGGHLAQLVFRRNPELIRSLRERAGLSQVQLARALGISNAAVSYYESGDRVPEPGTAGRYVSLLLHLTGLLARLPEPIATELDGYFPRTRESQALAALVVEGRPS